MYGKRTYVLKSNFLFFFRECFPHAYVTHFHLLVLPYLINKNDTLVSILFMTLESSTILDNATPFYAFICIIKKKHEQYGPGYLLYLPIE